MMATAEHDYCDPRLEEEAEADIQVLVALGKRLLTAGRFTSKGEEAEIMALVDACTQRLHPVAILQEIGHFTAHGSWSWSQDWQSDPRSRQYFGNVSWVLFMWCQKRRQDFRS